jgi:hypothetical protein
MCELRRRLGQRTGGPCRRFCAPAQIVLAFVVLALSASPATAAGPCSNEQLRSENGSMRLPDCRAYELVSPAEKTGGVGDVLAFEYGHQEPHPMQSTANPTVEGSAMTYNGEPFFQPKSGGLDQYTSIRGAGGWSTVNVTPPNAENIRFGQIVGASADLSMYLMASEGGGQFSAEAPAEYRNLYLVDRAGTVRPLITVKPPNRTSEHFGNFSGTVVARLLVAPASDDLSRVFFAANDALTANAIGGSGEDLTSNCPQFITLHCLFEQENNLYRWTAGQLHLVNVLPSGATEPNASFGFEYGGVVNSLKTPNLDHAVSADGMRVFWTDNNGNLYLRESYLEGGEEKERTVQVDGAEPGCLSCVGGGGRFSTATPDGSKAIFTDERRLTSSSTAESGKPDLYEYDVATAHEAAHLVDLTVASAGEHANVQGVVAASEDGEYVYFVADGVLTGAENARHQKAVVNGDNLYVYQPNPQAAGEHETAFIATLAPEDNVETAGTEIGGETVADWAPTVAQRAAEASPSGRFLAFGSHLALTGQGSSGAEIFMYDAATGALVCPSCRPNGASSEAFLPPAQDSYGTHRQRYMLDDGRLLFTTSTALVAQDVNGQKDVYEWERGEAHLISSGVSDRESVFADASESGGDVFFTTSEALVPQDQDEIIDVYDAKEGGGLPAPAVTPPCGTNDACHGAPPGSPEAGVPTSATFSGTGNLAAPAPPTPVVTHPALTRAQKLAQALRACRKKPKKKRVACESQARKKYGSKSKGKKTSRRGK